MSPKYPNFVQVWWTGCQGCTWEQKETIFEDVGKEAQMELMDGKVVVFTGAGKGSGVFTRSMAQLLRAQEVRMAGKIVPSTEAGEGSGVSMTRSDALQQVNTEYRDKT